MAIILVTHDWGVLADLCDRAVVMYAGEVVEEARVEDLYRAPRHPYTEGLLAANPRVAAGRRTAPGHPRHGAAARGLARRLPLRPGAGTRPGVRRPLRSR